MMTAEARPVRCTVCGPMGYDPDRRMYHCEHVGFRAEELAPYFELTDDEITLTPPGEEQNQ